MQSYVNSRCNVNRQFCFVQTRFERKINVNTDVSINVKSNIFFYRNFVLFVPAQDNVQYTLIGMGTGPQYFSIDPRSGSIRIRETLKDDPLKPTNYTVKNSVLWHCIIILFFPESVLVYKNVVRNITEWKDFTTGGSTFPCATCQSFILSFWLAWLIVWTNLSKIVWLHGRLKIWTLVENVGESTRKTYYYYSTYKRQPY